MSINPVWFLFASIQFNVSRFAFNNYVYCSIAGYSFCELIIEYCTL